MRLIYAVLLLFALFFTLTTGLYEDQAGRVDWCNGDAPPDTAASLDLTDKAFIREDLDQGLYPALRARLPNIPEDVVIRCGE